MVQSTSGDPVEDVVREKAKLQATAKEVDDLRTALARIPASPEGSATWEGTPEGALGALRSSIADAQRHQADMRRLDQEIRDSEVHLADLERARSLRIAYLIGALIALIVVALLVVL